MRHTGNHSPLRKAKRGETHTSLPIWVSCSYGNPTHFEGGYGQILLPAPSICVGFAPSPCQWLACSALSKTKATMGIHLTNVGRPKPYHDIEQPSCVHHSLCHSLFLPPPWGLYMIPIDLLLIPIPLWTMIPTFIMLHKLSWVHTLLGGMFQTHIFYT